ncbi:MAG: response regulator transcription factor [Planctomycetales bacterium]|nr:response regulator transcription factor [Planctomycetales bacterium]
MRVLVVEDYEPVRSAVVQALAEQEFVVDVALDGHDGLWQAQSGEHDVIVLDIMLPKVDGIEIVRQLRRKAITVPVLLLTALDAVEDRVAGLDSGADDYLVKPFSMVELLARVRALVRRRFNDASASISIGTMTIDTIARSVAVAGQPITLTAGEYKLLELLARRRGQIITRTEIWNSLYDMNSESASNVVDVYIGYLRRKLREVGIDELIETRRGIGYVMRESIE